MRRDRRTYLVTELAARIPQLGSVVRDVLQALLDELDG